MTTQRLPHTVLPGRGPYLFMLHGLLSSSAQWAPNLGALADVVTPVVFELWGHGASPAPVDDAAYLVAHYLAQFERVRTELGASQVLLCGQSFGAGITLNYAAHHPQRVRAQIFTNSLSALSRPGELRTPAQIDVIARDITTRGAAAIAQLPFHPARARHLPTCLKGELIRAADQVVPSALAKAMRVTGAHQSALASLGRITCPTLLVNGAHERRFQPLCKRAALGIGQLQIVDLPAGHAVNLEQVDGFNQAAVAFLHAHRDDDPRGKQS